MTATAPRCVALLGGSFDPVHNGHIALAAYFGKLLQPDELRLIPTGNPWQKDRLQTAPEHRLEMLRLAFEEQALPIVIDQTEIKRQGFTYTIDTLRSIRTELGPECSIVFLMGADQFQHLDTWQEWRHLFDYAHICAASRPGFALNAAGIPTTVADEISRRAGTLEQIRTTPQGLTYLAQELAIDISATEIRAQLQQGHKPGSLIPAVVLDYIEQHHLYKS